MFRIVALEHYPKGKKGEHIEPEQVVSCICGEFKNATFKDFMRRHLNKVFKYKQQLNSKNNFCSSNYCVSETKPNDMLEEHMDSQTSEPIGLQTLNEV